MHRAIVCSILLTALAAPSAVGFGHEAGLPGAGVQDVNARSLNVAAFHPFPDPQGDPWGLPYATVNGSRVDYMRATYDATLYPTAVFDGVDRMAGATQFQQTYLAYEEAYKARAGVDAPIRLGLVAVRAGPMAILQIEATAKASIESANLTLRTVLIEDDVRFEGGNGVELHRFTVRRILNETPVSFDGSATFNRTHATPLDAAWDERRVGFVVWIVNLDAGSRGFADGEILQAATYMLGQDGPTIQASRGVMLEYYTATWCPTCVYGDGALDELANSYGVTSSRILDRPYEYYRPFDVAHLAGAALAGAAAVLVLAIRARSRGGGAG